MAEKQIVPGCTISSPTHAQSPASGASPHPPEREHEEVLAANGGVHAWPTVAGGFFLYFAGLGYFNAYGVYQDFYVREFMVKSSPSEIAWIGTCQVALQFLLGLPVGKAFDAGYFHHLMTAGSLIYCFSLWMLSLAKPNQYYSVFLAQGVGLGVGLGLTFLPALGAAAHNFHFSSQRGLVIGLLSSGASIGGIVFPILLNALLSRHGFAIAVRATATLVTGLMLLANLLMRPQYSTVWSATKATPSLRMRKMLRDPPYVVFVISGIFVMLGLFYPIFYLQLYSIKRGIREAIAFDTISLINAGGVFGRLVPTFLADRIGTFNVVIPVIFGAAVCILCMLVQSMSIGGIVGIALVYGAVSAAYVSVTPALLTELSSDRSEVGLRMGVWFTFTAGAALAGQPLSGALIEGDSGFRWSTAYAGLCLCVGGCLLMVSRFLHLRRW